jgi:anthranilate synthase/aminodeoxychorismate synthase-like glutamine amidotransferase
VILLLDNYDSFVHNLARYLRRLGQETLVVRSDAIDAEGVRQLKPAAVVLSPGPCTPAEAGCSVSVVKELWHELPILGVCLGHQAIAAAFGTKIIRAPRPMHGRTSSVSHGGKDIFADVPNPVTVCRYHSLVVDEQSLPRELQITARTADGVIMGIQHATAPLVGLQFHPEAVLTEFGYRMLANFLRLARLPTPAELPAIATEWNQPPVAKLPYPDQPLTF